MSNQALREREADDDIWSAPESVRRAAFVRRAASGAGRTLAGLSRDERWPRPTAFIEADIEDEVAGELRDEDARVVPGLPDVPEEFLTAASNWWPIVATVLARRRVEFARCRAHIRGDRAAIAALKELCWRLIYYGRFKGQPMNASQIGRLLDRTHQTVLHHVRRHEAERLRREWPRSRPGVEK
jgi:hypothetical protein